MALKFNHEMIFSFHCFIAFCRVSVDRFHYPPPLLYTLHDGLAYCVYKLGACDGILYPYVYVCICMYMTWIFLKRKRVRDNKNEFKRQR